MTGIGVRRGKGGPFTGGEGPPAVCSSPKQSEQSLGEKKWANPLKGRSGFGPRASVQAATRVNAEQASKRSMCRPTRPPNRGRLLRPGEMSEEYAQPLHGGTGGSMYTRKAHATREAPLCDQG